MYVCICMYIYIQRERERYNYVYRERERLCSLLLVYVILSGAGHVAQKGDAATDAIGAGPGAEDNTTTTTTTTTTTHDDDDDDGGGDDDTNTTTTTTNDNDNTNEGMTLEEWSRKKNSGHGQPTLPANVKSQHTA